MNGLKRTLVDNIRRLIRGGKRAGKTPAEIENTQPVQGIRDGQDLSALQGYQLERVEHLPGNPGQDRSPSDLLQNQAKKHQKARKVK